MIALLDARRGEVFAAAWPSAGEASLLEPSVLEPAELGPLVRRVGPGALAIGDGVQVWPSILRDVENDRLKPVYHAMYDNAYRDDPPPRRDPRTYVGPTRGRGRKAGKRGG